MFVYSIIFSILIFLLITTKAQYSLHHTDLVSETDFYYDCLYYKVLDNIETSNKVDVLQSFHQIIPYCIRPLNKTEGHEAIMTNSSISSNFTFEQLEKKNVTTQDLLLWSAPIDLIERYQNYLNTPMLVSASDLFYNCTLLWFGPFCQYTFDSNEPFNEIVRKTFIAKENDTYTITDGDITNLTCYIHLECNHGPAPICLDWREICDGRIDCLGDSIDEKDCFDLEINECEENEYRCHNGMCIPEQFVNDNSENPDCLDQTDENDNENKNFLRILGFLECFQDPAFRCEESDPFSGSRGFVCGDGQQIKIGTLEKVPLFIVAEQLQCANRRDTILVKSVITGALRSSNLTGQCQLAMTCITSGKYIIGCVLPPCKGGIFPCSLSIKTLCNQSNYVMLPILPVIQGYAQFGYWTNKPIIYESLEQIPVPHFVCYDIKRCPFFLSQFKINNLTCFHLSNLSSWFTLDHMIILFHTCLPVDKSGNETGCFHPSLFHCPDTAKCISKYRLLDGVIDCPDGADEIYIDSCNLSQRHRFQCASENECISPVVMRNLLQDCRGGEDEYVSYRQKLPFQNLCNGYTHLSPVFIDGHNETDETNCEQWPCNNQYTQCDGAWTCPNGADEINCNSASQCYPNHHECISPATFEVMCLPMNHAGDGNVDCLGATDERDHCRHMYPTESFVRYRCWNDTACTIVDCVQLSNCPFEQSNSIQKVCETDLNVRDVLKNLLMDIWLGSPINRVDRYFVLLNISRFQSNALFIRSVLTHDSWSMPTERISRVDADFSTKVLPRHIDFRHAWICNRGITIFVGTEMSEHCLCPPSYYGNRCQFQNQRVSLTLQFSKECAPNCYGAYGIVVTLIDSSSEIHSYEQLTYISTNNCDMKYNLYLLYRSRPKDLTKNYTIRIDAYNKIHLAYHTSWILPVKLLFLPVNRIAAYLIIPSHPVGVPNDCQLVCGDRGRCAIYTNTKEYFCRCDSGWSGRHCSIRLDNCVCSLGSICLGNVNNRSICLCPPNKSGRRCFIHSICQDNPCKNGGQCVPEDDRISMSTFTCICGSGYSGSTCDVKDTRIEILFNNAKIPQSLMIYFVTVQQNDDPLLTTIAKKAAFDQDSIVLYISVLFNLIFVQIDTEFYLAFLQVNASRLVHIELEMKTFHHCSTVQNLLDNRTRNFPLLRRVKYYHALCQNHSQLSCLHDNEAFMCLCNQDGYANCLSFNFNKTSICPGRTTCENGGQCLLDRAKCPTTTLCICPECFYGGRCQFTTKTFGLSLDVILGLQIRPHVIIVQQSMAVKVSIVLTTLVLVIGLINGILSIMTFQLKNLCNVGCGLYLLALSITSLISTVAFTLKFWLLILSQISWITNRTILLVNCISIEFIIRSLLTISDWLSACVAIERVIVVIKSVNFNQIKSKQTARYVIIGVVLCILLSLLHDPIHRQLIDDEEEQRTWCIVQYSSAMKIFDSTMHILHFFIPFSINVISAIVIIVMVARTHSITRKQQTYQQHLRKQFNKHKHLVISPMILVILALPRLIISFLSGCMKSIRDPWLFLIGYFISFMPPLLTFIVFVWPSATYKREFNMIIERYRMATRRRLHLI